MKKVERFECEFCGKVFKIDRHFCFRDPKNKACGSCDNYLGEFTNYDGDHAHLCRHEEKEYTIYDSYSGKSEVPFQSKHNSRGYNCDWWEKRK